MSHWTEKLINFCKFDSVTDQNKTNQMQFLYFPSKSQVKFLRKVDYLKQDRAC
jgi:hypothetical protein